MFPAVEPELIRTMLELLPSEQMAIVTITINIIISIIDNAIVNTVIIIIIVITIIIYYAERADGARISKHQ